MKPTLNNQKETPKIHCSHFKYSVEKYNTITKYRVCLDNAILIKIFLGMRKELQKIIVQDKHLASAYIKGIMAGEGTVYHNRSKYVRIEMKNETEMKFIAKLLKILRIRYTVHKRPKRPGMISFYIGGRENISRFYEIAGFGCHLTRQEKLRKLVNSY